VWSPVHQLPAPADPRPQAPGRPADGCPATQPPQAPQRLPDARQDARRGPAPATQVLMGNVVYPAQLAAVVVPQVAQLLRRRVRDDGGAGGGSPLVAAGHRGDGAGHRGDTGFPPPSLWGGGLPLGAGLNIVFLFGGDDVVSGVCVAVTHTRGGGRGRPGLMVARGTGQHLDGDIWTWVFIVDGPGLWFLCRVLLLLLLLLHLIGLLLSDGVDPPDGVRGRIANLVVIFDLDSRGTLQPEHTRVFVCVLGLRGEQQTQRHVETLAC